MSAPTYSRIAAELRDQIEGGEFAPHEALPSERRLSERHAASRMTVRHALGVLEREGLIYRRPGRGNFVAEPRIGMHMGSFSEEVLRGGRRPGARILRAERLRPTGLVAEALDLGEQEDVLITQRLRFADADRLAVETSHWPASRMPDLLTNLTEGSLWSVARERYGLVPTFAEARLEAIALDEFSAAQLGVRPGRPGILLTRWTFDQHGRCFELARDVYRGDRSEFRVRTAVHAPGSDGGLVVATKG